MARASRSMVFHYMGYFGSMILVWLVMVLTAAPQPLRVLQAPLIALLAVAAVLFGSFGILYIIRGGHRGEQHG